MNVCMYVCTCRKCVCIFFFHSVCSGELPACDMIKSRFGGSWFESVQDLCGETSRGNRGS